MSVRDVEAGEMEDGAARRRLLEEQAHQQALRLRRAVVDDDLWVDGVAEDPGRDPQPRRDCGEALVKATAHVPEMLDDGPAPVDVERRQARGEGQRVTAEG